MATGLGRFPQCGITREFPPANSRLGSRAAPAESSALSTSTDTSRPRTGTTPPARSHLLGRSRSAESARQHLAQPLAYLGRAAAPRPA